MTRYRPIFWRIISFGFGLATPFLALKLILSRPKLMFLSALPIFLAFMFYGYLMTHGQAQLEVVLAQLLMKWGLNSHPWIARVLFFISKIFIFLVSVLTFGFTSTVIAAPFNDLLAEASEPWVKPSLKRAPSPSILMRLRFIGHDIAKSMLAVILGIAALFLSWVPLLGLFVSLIPILLITFQFISYPQTRRGQGVAVGLRFLWKHFFSSLGFGVTIASLFAIPILWSFCIPLAVVGGTILFARASTQEALFTLR